MDESTKKNQNPFEATVFGNPEESHDTAKAPVAKEGVEWFAVLVLLKGREHNHRYLLTRGEILIGRDPRMDLAILNDSMVSRRHACIIWENFDAPGEYPRCYIQDLKSSNGILLNNKPALGIKTLNDGDRIQIGSTLFGYYVKDNHELEYDNNLRSMATIDSLTGLVNRRAFLMDAQRSIAQAVRYNEPLCLTILDIDRFKIINDTFGHGAGDTVLHHLSSIMSDCLREGDILGRMGGDEFVVLMPETHVNEALIAVERLRMEVATQTLVLENNRIKFTVSVGISSISPMINNWELLYRAADAALYESKNKGRNRVCISHAED
jgi:diguanylate cyclase (GGDEF)-like protein